MIAPRESKDQRLRAAQIAALGLVWAVALGAVVRDRVQVRHQDAANRAQAAAADVVGLPGVRPTPRGGASGRK